MQKESEIHLFLLWEYARRKESEIIDDINHNFVIQKVLVIKWSDDIFSNNLSRFYGQNLPPNCHKEKHVGKGPFLVIVVEDQNPIYDIRDTSHGSERVNVNMFDKKALYRSWTGGGHKIHATDKPKETKHNLTLLTGKNTEDFLQSFDHSQAGEIASLNSDCTGSKGWDSVEQLFYVLNNTTEYLVLRNFENIPHDYHLAEHGDIDLLTDRRENIKLILNANPLFNEEYRVFHHVIVAGHPLQFDLRYLGDNYYDKNWESYLLSNKILSPNGFYRPDPESYFYTLLYHALVHKPEIAQDYKDRLPYLAKEAGVQVSRLQMDSPEELNKIVQHYLSKKGFTYMEPKDLSVFYNNSNADNQNLSVERILTLNLNTPKIIEKILSQTEDRSVNSPELKRYKFSDEVELRNQFSPYRGLPIDIWNIPNNTKVLEIGSELGAVTRYLGENFVSVTAVGIGKEKINTTRLRCTNLPHVNILNLEKGLGQISTDHDLAVIILSFAPLSDKNSGIIELKNRLNMANMFTHGDGQLVLAVENINSLRNLLIEDKILGLDNSELENLLLESGFTQFEFAYAYPDHYLGQNFLSQRAVDLKIKPVENWTGSVPFQNKKGEKISWEKISPALKRANENGMLGKMANSFVVYASKNRHIPHMEWFIKSFNGEQRIKEAWTQTTLEKKSGELMVQKIGTDYSIYPFCFKPNSLDPLFEGETLENLLLDSIRRCDQTGFFNFFDQFSNHLINKYPIFTNDYGPCGKNDVFVKGEALDINGKNIIVTSQGWCDYDKEWQVVINLPVSFLNFRLLLLLNSRISNNELVGSLKINELGVITADIKDSYVLILNQIQCIEIITRDILETYYQFHQSFADFTFKEDFKPGERVNKFLELIGIHKEKPLRTSQSHLI